MPNENQENNEKLRLLVLAEVKGITKLSRSSIYAKIKDPKSNFPKPFKLGNGAVNYWVESEIEKWIEDSIKASRKEMA